MEWGEDEQELGEQDNSFYKHETMRPEAIETQSLDPT